jgi:superfamily II DNA or RNA helicase
MVLKRQRPDGFYRVDYTVYPSDADETFRDLSHTEKEIVRIADECNDKVLYKLFSKDRSIRDFQEKVTPDKLTGFIRPYFEKRIARILETVRGTDIKVCMRDKTSPNIYPEDFLEVMPLVAEPVFRFSRGTEGSTYRLEINYAGQRISLLSDKAEVVTDTPAIVRIDRKVYFVRDIEARKIRPFFERSFISVPMATEAKYFRTFVLNMIRDYEVEADGFTINHVKASCKALVNIEKSLDNHAVIVLRFTYNSKTILANAAVNVFVDFRKERDAFVYDRYARDVPAEERVHHQLEEFGLMSYDRVNYELKGSRGMEFEEQLADLLEWINRNYGELSDCGLIPGVRTGGKAYYTGSFDLLMGSKLENDWFDIHALVKLGDMEMPFWKFRNHILENRREYELPDGRIFVLPREWLTRYHDLFEFATGENGKLRLHKQHFSILEKAEKGFSPEELERLERLNRRDSLPQTALPRGLTLELRPYQYEGYTWLYYLQQNKLGGCLADDMGLGKTVQAIALLLKNKEECKVPAEEGVPKTGQLDLFGSLEQPSFPVSLVVVPASLVYNWVNELRKFGPGLKVLAFTGGQRSKNAAVFRSADVVISSYHIVRQDIELFSSFRFHHVILDESQLIKNPSSRVYQAINMLNCGYRLVLTGTPIENSLTDLWAQMNFVNPGLLGNLNFFRREFVLPVEKKGDRLREEKLRSLINPFILRRTKEEVARELPEVSEQTILCSMTEEQREIYEEEKAGIRNAIFDNLDRQETEKTSMIVLQGLTRLRQISNHPKLVDVNYRAESGKYLEVQRNIENVLLEGHKVLVFSSFVKHLELIKEGLEQNGVGYTLLTGASVNRGEIVNAFQENPHCRVFLISLKAGGVGLNLTAADYVFILDPWWNPASEDQAVSRAHRMGQQKNVFVYRFISEGSIEEKIQRLQERKAELADTFVRSNNPVKDISRRELEELFA